MVDISVKDSWDERDSLSRYSRKELEHIARWKGWTDIEPGMPAKLMRRRMRGRDTSDLPPPLNGSIYTNQQKVTPPYDLWKKWVEMGAPNVMPDESSRTSETVDAEDALEAQWKGREEEPAPEPEKPLTMPQLRRKAKEMGLKQSPKDTAATLKAKIDGHAAECGQ